MHTFHEQPEIWLRSAASVSVSLTSCSASGAHESAALSSIVHPSLKPPLLLSPIAVQQKLQLEKETGLKIVEAGVSDVSISHPQTSSTLLWKVKKKRAGMTMLIFCIWADKTGEAVWFQFVLTPASHLQLQLCSQTVIFYSKHIFQCAKVIAVPSIHFLEVSQSCYHHSEWKTRQKHDELYET